jgi:hypothetical protein
MCVLSNDFKIYTIILPSKYMYNYFIDTLFEQLCVCFIAGSNSRP